MVAIEIEVGMISAGQTIILMARDGQFRPAIGGKDPHGRIPHHDRQDSPLQGLRHPDSLCAPPAGAIEGTVPVPNESLIARANSE